MDKVPIKIEPSESSPIPSTSHRFEQELLQITIQATPSDPSPSPTKSKKEPIPVSVDEKSGGIHFFHNPKTQRTKPAKKKRPPKSTITSDGDQSPPKKRIRKKVKRSVTTAVEDDDLDMPSTSSGTSTDTHVPPNLENEELKGKGDNKNFELVDLIGLDEKPNKWDIIDLTLDLIGVAIDEISLEGLDGITIEALWKRISMTLHQPLPFSKKVENFVWDGVRNIKDILFYKLEEPRPDLIIFDRFLYSNPETGYIIDYENAPPDIYPYVPINDKANNIMGSCSTYETRKDVYSIVRYLNLSETVERFGNHLVLVASQKLRNKALIPGVANPMLPFTEQQYCILERVGRSRRFGELTCGTQSLQTICKDSKTLFYYRKMLIKHMLLSKQNFCFKNKHSQNMMGILFHLQRFYNQRKSRKQLMIEQVIKLLKTRPNFRMEYIELRMILGNDNWEKLSMVKLIKSQEFRNLVKTDIMLEYREVYPNASTLEWKTKSNKERRIRVLELINPDVNVNALWKDEDPKDSSSDEEIIGDMILNAPILKQSYDTLFRSGRNGLSLKELQAHMGSDYYSTRSLLKKLQSQKLIETCMVDEGRLRFAKYYAKCFDDECFYQQFLEEKAKPILPVEHRCDEETLDFISNILEIDKNDLKPNNNAEEIVEITDDYSNTELLKGRYREINSLRNSTKKKNKRESICEESLETNNKLAIQEIFKNDHGYYDFNTSVKEQIVSPNNFELVNVNNSFKDVCSNIFNSNEMVVDNGISISINVNRPVVHHWQEMVKKKRKNISVSNKIRKFVPVLSRLYNKSPNSLAKSYKLYYQRLNIIFESLSKDLKDKKDAPTNFVSSDEEIDEESNSIIVNLETEDNAMLLGVEDFKDVKKVLIENFQTTDVHFLDKLTDFTKEELLQLNENSAAKRQSTDIANSPKIIKTEESVEGTSIALPVESVILKEEKLDVFGVKMEDFMGPKPILITSTCDDDGVEMKLIVSTDPKDMPAFTQKPNSERVNFRTKFIRDTVEKTILITDLSKLMQILYETERMNGYNVMVDRKSLDRIYAKLARDGHIIMAKIIVRYENIVRTKNLIVWPKVDLKTIIASAIDHFKMSFFIYAKRKMAPKIELPPKPIAEAEEDNPTQRATHMNVRYKYSRTIGRMYGFYPKIAKMRVLHEVLHYLVYSYTGKLVKKEKMSEILDRYCDNADDTLLNECSPMYKDEISWKTFISPLPQHKGWPSGWLLICDVLLRLPLSIFVKIFNVTYIIPELSKTFLNHPVRKHFLIKNLPADTRDAILSYRKYIFSIHDVFCHLCYIGAIQFGPQKLREKDQLFVYVNKNAILYDTTSSPPGYHQISKKEYPKLSYRFDTYSTLDRYWSDLYSMSMSTKLGQRASVLGKYISLENLHSKEAMIDAMKPQTQESAIENDVGYMPGDGLGACCTDSALWMHIKRNWIWSTQAAKPTKSNTSNVLLGMRRKHIQDLKPIKFSDYLKQNEKKSLHKPNEQQATTSGKPRKSVSKKKIPVSIIQQRKAVLRKVKPRKCFSKRERVDAIDKNIIALMGKSRAIFAAEEDRIIQLCKCVIDYLCPNQRKRTVVYSVVRDFIHRVLPFSRKTSAAYKRRMMQLRKSDNLQDKKQPLEFNLNSNYFTQKHFKQIRNKIRNPSNHIGELEVSLSFLYLAYYTLKAWKNSPTDLLPNAETYINYLNESYINRLKSVDYKDEEEECIYQDPKNEEDICLDTIKSVIHSSLGCQNATQEWPYQLLKVYQSFSEHLLRTALNLLRDQQLISGKKASTKHSGGREGSILMCGTSYHLSFGYTFKQITKYPSYIFGEALDYLLSIYKYCNDLKINAKAIDKFEQGNGLGMSEMATALNIAFRFELPEDVISLDPNIEDRSDLIKELAIRYKLLMSRKNQEDNEEHVTGIEKDEDVRKLEKVLENFITAHFSKDETEKYGLENKIANDLKQIFGTAEGNKVLDETGLVECVPVLKVESCGSPTLELPDEADWRNKPGTSKDSEAASMLLNLASPFISKAEKADEVIAQSKTVENIITYPTSNNAIQQLCQLPKTIYCSDEHETIRVDRRFRALRVSDLAFLLTKGLFPELDDDDRLEKLNKHFLVRYPTCKFMIKDPRFEENGALYRGLYLDVLDMSKQIYKDLEKSCIVKNIIPDETEYQNALKDFGGNDLDLALAEEILNFIHLKNINGASSKDLKDNFTRQNGNLDLKTIVTALIDIGVIIRTGIYNIAFVHFNFRHHWTIYLDSSKNSLLEKDSVGYRVKINPWIRIDGSVHTSILDNWLSIILSHCLCTPFIPLSNLFKRFCYIKPVDIYTILELLEKLKCITIMAYGDPQETDLFSEILYMEKAPANITDNFANVFVETDNLATIKFGAYLNKDSTLFNIPFEE